MSTPDVVYVVRQGEDNEELRWSLRSLANLPHGQVCLAGYRPAWATGVLHLSTMQDGSKYANSTRNLLTACMDDRLSDDVVLMNDDFFVMTQVPGDLPTMHRGPVPLVARTYPHGRYRQGMTETAALLEELGVEEPVSYELHVPMIVNRAAMVETLRVGVESGIDCLHKRTLYGNLMQLGGRLAEDVKVHNAKQVGWSWYPFLSTSDSSFARLPVGQFIRDAFPEPSEFEAAELVAVA